MIDYPVLKPRATGREMLDVFKGYNRNLRLKEGELRDMENLSSDGYPALTVRRQRRTAYNASKLEGEITGVAGFSDKYGLIHTQGEKLYGRGAAIQPEYMKLNAEAKRFVFMGTYLIVLPDMKYFNMDNYADCGSLGHTEETTEGEVTFQLCKADGEEYQVTAVQDTQPQSPADGALWIDTSDTIHVLKQYSAAMEQWVTVTSTYIKISGLSVGTDGELFRQYDGVRISGISVAGATHLNGSAVIQSKYPGRSIVIPGILDKTVTQTCTADEPIRVERRVPVMDYMVEAGNRLWGCRYGKNLDGDTVNEIYCSKLGDPRNWECYMGISTDSWAASLGSQGPFTGVANIGGSPVFYKRDMRHKVWISSTGAHQIADLPCKGVMAGCGGSVAVMENVAVYKSLDGFCMDDGSGPVDIGQCFAGAEYRDAVGCVCGHKYYVLMTDSEQKRHLFVYDADRKLWHREAAGTVSAIVGCGTWAAGVDGKKILDMTSGTLQKGAMEGPVRWMAELGEMGLESPDRKYVSRLDLRLAMEVGAELTVYIRYDSGPDWEVLGSISGTTLRTFSLPLRLRRCDHFALRLEGVGDVKLYSITKTIMKGSDRR